MSIKRKCYGQADTCMRAGAAVTKTSWGSHRSAMESVGRFGGEEVIDLVNNALIKTIPPPIQMKTSTQQFLISLSLS